MNLFRIIVFFSLASLAVTGSVQAQDSCLKILGPFPSDTNWSNPDSVKVDSCIGTTAFGQEYAKQWFHIEFTYYILPTPNGPEDTIIDRTWHDIDTMYSTTRNAFDTIEQKYGSFIFRRFHPEDTDTSLGRSSLFNIRFNNYVHIDSVVSALKNVPIADRALYSHVEGAIKLDVDDLPKNNISINNKIIISRFKSQEFDFLGRFDNMFMKHEVVCYSINGAFCFKIQNDVSNEIIFKSLLALHDGTYILEGNRSKIVVIVSE